MPFLRHPRANTARDLAGLAAPLVLLASCGGGTDTGTATETAAATEAAAPAPEVVSPAKLTAAKGAAPERPQGLDLPPDDPILGPVLVIDGEIVPHELIRRQIVLGSAGTIPIEMAKLKIFIDEEIQRQVSDGAASDAFVVADQEVEATIEQAKEAMQAEYDEEIDFAEIGMEDESLMTQARLEARLRRVFLPDDPADYPLTTLEALNASEDGKSILEHVRQTYDEKVAEEQTGKKDLVAERMINQILMEKVLEYLNSTAVIEHGDSVPSDIVMRVNGKDITVDEVWQRIKDKISDVEVRLAKQWIVNTALLERALRAEGVWLSEEEAALAYDEQSEPYKDSLFSIERVAVVIKKFPNEYAYKEYSRIYESYKQLIADQLTNENLKEFGEKRTKALIGLTRVDADVILLSAYDFKKGAWKPNGWREARERAEEVLRLLVEEERPWDEVLDDHSDFYDPPTPKNLQGLPDKQLNKGRFRGRPRNQLLGLLGESDYWQFLHGTSITDFIFFDQEEGKVETPLRGPYGWYVPKLIRRARNPAQLIQDQDVYLTMVEQDYIQTHLGDYTRKLIAESSIYGLE